MWGNPKTGRGHVGVESHVISCHIRVRITAEDSRASASLYCIFTGNTQPFSSQIHTHNPIVFPSVTQQPDPYSLYFLVLTGLVSVIWLEPSAQKQSCPKFSPPATSRRTTSQTTSTSSSMAMSTTLQSSRMIIPVCLSVFLFRLPFSSPMFYRMRRKSMQTHVNVILP